MIYAGESRILKEKQLLLHTLQIILNKHFAYQPSDL